MPNSQFESVDTRTEVRADTTLAQPNTTATEFGVFYGTERDDWLSTVPQYPHLVGLGGNDRLTGDDRDNRLYGNSGSDLLVGHAGNDTLDGGTGEDRMEGGSGDDTYFVDNPRDVVVETADGGYDIVIANAPVYGSTYMGDHVEEMIMTGTGWQAGYGNAQDNLITGTDDVNYLVGNGGNDTIYGGGGVDKIYGDDDAHTAFGHDVLFGGNGNDTLYGGRGNDVLRGGDGADVLSGGTGYDTAGFEDAQSGVVIDLTKPYENSGGATGDVLHSIENLIGSKFGDTLSGSQARNRMDGGEGDDRLYGGERGDVLRGGDGDDFLDGGVHRDVLTGGEGADTFYFASAAEAGDRITDFTTGDHIALSAEGFGLDSIDDFAFVLTTDPLTEMPTLIYNASSGNLSWDADGSGGEAAVYFATLTDAPALSQNDFLII